MDTIAFTVHVASNLKVYDLQEMLSGKIIRIVKEVDHFPSGSEEHYGNPGIRAKIRVPQHTNEVISSGGGW
jgi:hypothetical protein